jgi:hypothetical protein
MLACSSGSSACENTGLHGFLQKLPKYPICKATEIPISKADERPKYIYCWP